MANERIHDMPQTKGVYQVRGVISGVEKQDFYSEKKTKTGKDFRMVSFGVKYDHNKTISMMLNGMPKDKIYLSKKNSDGKTVTKAINWSSRNNIDPDGFRLIGVNVGLTKTTDKNGKQVNDKKVLTEFDACSYIAETMKDDSSVFVRGRLDFSSYMNDQNEVTRSIKLIPNQISLCKDVDFTEYNDVNPPMHDFTQTIVFMGIDQEKIDDKATGRFIVEAKIVNYNSIESTSFIVENAKLANQLRKALKPYWAITVHGKINIVNNIQIVNEEDCWGDSNPMDKAISPFKRELVITGATPSSIDKESYTEKAISEAIRKMNAAKTAEMNFEGKAENTFNDGWGDINSINDDEDTPWG